MTYTATAIALLLTCALAGTLGGEAASRYRAAAIIAAVMTATQLLLLIRQ